MDSEALREIAERHSQKSCRYCDTTGKVHEKELRQGDPIFNVGGDIYTCPKCLGSGFTIDKEMVRRIIEAAEEVIEKVLKDATS